MFAVVLKCCTSWTTLKTGAAVAQLVGTEFQSPPIGVHCVSKSFSNAALLMKLMQIPLGHSTQVEQ